jgi:hypothetical protein
VIIDVYAKIRYARPHLENYPMTHTIKKQDNNQIELTITVTSAEYTPHLQTAAKRLSERKAVKGLQRKCPV